MIDTPWFTQPQYPVQVSREFSTAASVIVVGGEVVNLAPRGGMVMPTSATVAPGPNGFVGWKTDGTQPPFRNVGKVPYFEGPEGLTLMYVFSSTDTSAIQYVAGTLDTGANYAETLATNRKSDGSAGAGWLYVDLRDAGAISATIFSTSAATTCFDGLPHCVVVQWTVASAASKAACRIWIDGVAQTLTDNTADPNTGAHSQAAGLTEFDYYINTRNLRGTPGALSLNGTIYLFGRWLTSALNGQSLSENPWQIFQSVPQYLWAPAAAGTFIPLIGRGPGMSLARKGGGLAARG